MTSWEYQNFALSATSGTVILTSLVLPPAGVFPFIFTLDLNDSEFAKLSFGSFLQYYHKIADAFE